MPSAQPAVAGVSTLDLARNTLEQVLKIKSTNEYSSDHVRTARYNAWQSILLGTPMTDEARTHYETLVEWLYGSDKPSVKPLKRSTTADGFCASKWAGV